MKRNRLIFYSVIGVLHLVLFFSTLYIEYVAGFDEMYKIYQRIWLLKYCSVVLIFLFLTNIILHLRDNKRHTRENAQLIQELNTLKAKLYDLQESKKTSEPNPTKPV